MINQEVLIRLYSKQPYTAEKLGGTAALSRLGDAYRLEVDDRDPYSNMDLLQVLLDLRKAGKLPRKTDRVLGKPAPQVWPSVSQIETLDGVPFYRIPIEVDVTREHIIAVITTALMCGHPEPLSRAEVYAYVQKWLPRAGDSGLDTPTGDRAWAITRRLFPEFDRA